MDINITLNAGATVFIGSDGKCTISDGNPDMEQNTELLKENGSLKETVKAVSDENAELRSQKQELTRALTHSDDEIAQLKAELTEKDSKDSEMEALWEETEKEQREKIQKLTDENIKLSSKLEALEQALKSKGTECEALLVKGDEKDFFEDEVKDYVLEVLSDALKDLPESTRKKDVIKDIVKTNRFTGFHKALRQKLKDSVSSADGDIASVIENFGFVKEKEVNSHIKCYYHGDRRYMTSLSVTASDYRSANNAVSNIIKCYF